MKLWVKIVNMKIWQAVVTESSDRDIKISTSSMKNLDVWIKPLIDGVLKLPPPANDEYVWVIQPTDFIDENMRYLPVNLSFTNDDSATIQIGDAIEFTVLGETLIGILEDLCDALATETHTGNIGAPTSPPLNSSTYASLKAQLVNAKSTKVKIA